MNDLPRKIIDDMVEIVKNHLDPARILLFGSRAKGRDKTYSDFDIAVQGVNLELRRDS